ncbi:hypothetical protein I3843_07G230100 [Carya illinoinensis]|nr:hypothetical protein I3843_07G230100 [Carya illinoinensis]
MAARNSILSESNSESRGALIVLEGLDRSGKTSQSSNLLKYLEGLGHSAELWRFPDRSTDVGQMISSYLTNKSQLDDHTVHILFSANRWEKRFVMLLFLFNLLCYGLWDFQFIFFFSFSLQDFLYKMKYPVCSIVVSCLFYSLCMYRKGRIMINLGI